jgi:hypothetical protein
LVVPVGELSELAQSAPPARYEGPGRWLWSPWANELRRR